MEQWEEDVQNYLQMGLYQPALDLVEEVLKKGKDKRALTYKAYILRSMERDDEALEIVDALLREEEDEDLLLLKGMILFDNENYKDAAMTLRKSMMYRKNIIENWWRSIQKMQKLGITFQWLFSSRINMKRLWRLRRKQ